MRDMAEKSPLEHREEYLAADVRLARVMVGHDSLRRRQYRDAKTIVDPWQVLDGSVDPPSGLGDPLDLADHRLAVEIFQLDLEFVAPRRMLHRRITADVAFCLQHLEHALAHPGARRGHLRFGAHLRVADATDQIADRIVCCHSDDPPYQLDFNSPGTRPLEPSSRSAMRLS